MKLYIMGFVLCAVAGGLASYFGRLGGVTAVVIAELGIVLSLTYKK